MLFAENKKGGRIYMPDNNHSHGGIDASHSFHIHWDVRLRFFAVFIWLIGIGIAQSPIMLIVSAVIAIAASCAFKVPLSRMMKRIRIAVPFLCLSFLTLLLAEGLPVTTSAYTFALMIALRIAASLFALTLVSVEDIKVYLSGFSSMKLPAALTSTLFLTQRYVHLIFQQMASVKNALISRLFSPQVRLSTLRVYGQIIGGTMVKAIDRSESIKNAMVSRGFHGKVWTSRMPPIGWKDVLLTAICVLTAICGVCIDRWWFS